MAASVAATRGWFVVVLTAGLADVVELASTGIGVGTALGRTNRPILPSFGHPEVAVGPGGDPARRRNWDSVMTPCVVIRPIPAPGVLSAK